MDELVAPCPDVQAKLRERPVLEVEPFK